MLYVWAYLMQEKFIMFPGRNAHFRGPLCDALTSRLMVVVEEQSAEHDLR